MPKRERVTFSVGHRTSLDEKQPVGRGKFKERMRRKTGVGEEQTSGMHAESRRMNGKNLTSNQRISTIR